MPWTALPFVAQGALMIADERFHRERGLPAWERWGHPVDTFVMAACHGLALFAPRTPAGLAAYAAMAALSCLCVTKDEWAHARHCRGAENWLHALLFLLHPVLLALAGGWAFGGLAPLPGGFAGQEGFGAFLRVQAGLTIGFGIWQIAYWNGPWGRARPVLRKGRERPEGNQEEWEWESAEPKAGARRPPAAAAAGRNGAAGAAIGGRDGRGREGADRMAGKPDGEKAA